MANRGAFLAELAERDLDAVENQARRLADAAIADLPPADPNREPVWRATYAENLNH